MSPKKYNATQIRYSLINRKSNEIKRGTLAVKYRFKDEMLENAEKRVQTACRAANTREIKKDSDTRWEINGFQEASHFEAREDRAKAWTGTEKQ